MKKNIFYQAIIAVAVILAAACSKNKGDVRPGNLPDYSNMAKSTVRIINLNPLLGGTDMMVNGTKLTNWQSAHNGLAPDPYPTPYFPATGKLSGSYYLPQQFLDKNGEAIVKLYGVQLAPATDYLLDSFKVEDNYQQPWDYYSGTNTTDESNSVARVPRGITAPADPANIRIRLVNLSQGLPNKGTDNLSLAYADGTIVSDVTSGIARQNWSDYIELPYGTYQFKVLIDDESNQIPGKPPVLTTASSLTDFSYGSSQVYYAPVQTYQPGGVYTIVVASMSGYQFGDTPIPTNCFSVINDVEPPANITYGRIQAINAFNEDGLTLQIDNGPAVSLPYGAAGDYSTQVKGSHAIKITDASGKTVIEESITVNGGDNLSLWVYPTTTGAGEISMVQNNMTGIRNTSSNTDGSDTGLGVYDPLKFGMLLQTRFLNFCPDLPYVTFTASNGGPFANNNFSSALAAQNLQPGQVPDKAVVPYPYADMGFVTGGLVNAYRSRPGVVPGDRLIEVPALVPADFVKMPPYFFHDGNFGSEPGNYTVALVGRSDAGHQPKMIVIKHNR